MTQLETLIRDIVRSELNAVRMDNSGVTAVQTKGTKAEEMTAGQKAARTRKLRAAGRKAWETRRRNAAKR